MDPIAAAHQVFDIEIEALKAVRAQIDRSFAAAVDAILATVAKNRKVVVCGVGKSGNIGVKIAATFNSTGTVSVALNSVDALHGDIGVIADGDALLAISYSGESEELTQLIPAFKRFRVAIIAITGQKKSTLAEAADIHLRVKAPKEACPFNLAPTSSATATLVMGDALAMSVLKARGFKKKDFARLHPKGAIGRSLLLRAKDIMRSQDRNPVAEQNRTVKEALLIMTQSRSGSVSVVDRQGRLTGVFTDGDFRRLMAEDDNALQAPLRKVMTPNPVSIRDTALAVDILKIFDDRRIDDLIVVDRKRTPVGVIDSQDFPKLKLT